MFGSLGPEGLFREDTPYAPNSPYSASKAGSDHLVRAWRHTYGLPTIATNCSNNYGPYHFPEKLIPLTILNALEHKSLPVYGRGENVRDWLFVEDHVDALLCVIERGRVGESYNVGGLDERRNIDVVHMICDLVDEMSPDAGKKPRRGLISYVQDRPGHDLRYAIDCSKIQDRAWLEPARNLRVRLAQDGSLVSRQPAVVAADPRGNLPGSTVGSRRLTRKMLISRRIAAINALDITEALSPRRAGPRRARNARLYGALEGSISRVGPDSRPQISLSGEARRRLDVPPQPRDILRSARPAYFKSACSRLWLACANCAARRRTASNA